MTDQPTEIDRTPPIGLFNYARSYWCSAEQLRASKPDVTHPSAPILFLMYHSLELYLKAYLRSAGFDLGQLKGISHKIAKAGRAAHGKGLSLTTADFDLLELIDSNDNVIRSRYITTGAQTRPEDEELSDFCVFLDKAVGNRLAADGHPVQALRIVTSPAPPRTETQNLAEEIETLSETEQTIIAYLLHHKQRMFTCAVDGGRAATLIARGIVRSAAKSGQMFSYDDMPIEIPLEVWRFLRENIEQFPYLGDGDEAYPWRKHWME